MVDRYTFENEKIYRADIHHMLGDLGEVFKPPRRIKVADCVEENVMIATPGGYAGKWSRTQTPYMVEPMNMISSRNHHSVIFAGPARTGKTQGLIDGGIGYVVCADPADMLVVHMTEEAARRYSRLRVKRMLNNSPALRARMSPAGHDDNVLGKYFKNGTALILAWPSPTQLSAQDYKYVFCSDYDRMPDDTGEGDVYSLAMKRTQTFMSGGMCVVESSPGRDFIDAGWKKESPHQAPPVGGILGLYNGGDRRLWYWVCPHCGEEIMLYPGLDLFCLPEQAELVAELQKNGAKTTASKYSSIFCPHCGSQIDHSQKSRLNQTGRWKAERDTANSTASYWLSGVAAAFQPWTSLLEKEFNSLLHFTATGEEEKLKATRNTDQGVPYIPLGAAEKLSVAELKLRAEDLPKRVIPKDVRFLLAAVDVQANRFVVQIEGIGRDMERWMIDRFNIAVSERESHGENAIIDPAGHKEDWLLLIDRVLKKRYPLEDDERTMGVAMTTCDSGGKEGVTENAYWFWRECKRQGLHDRFSLIKGERTRPDAKKPMVSRTMPDKSSTAARKANVVGEMPLWILNTTLLKDAVSANLTRKEPGPDYVHFPDWLPDWWYAELVAEVRTEKGWENPTRSRNESFDLMCYAKAGYLIKLDAYWKKELNWDSPPPWADEWDNNSEVSGHDGSRPQGQSTQTTRRVRMRVKR